MTDPLPLIYDLDLPELQDLLKSWGEPAFRARQIWQGLYQHLWDSPEQFTNIPASLREKLFTGFRFSALQPAQVLSSNDGETVKTLFTLWDGRAIEAVLMRYSERRTLCISSQAGCAMGCVFCATGQMGFKRHLTSGEIVAQVLHYARILQAENDHVTNVVIMGMGEPFHNYNAVLHAVDRLNHPEGFKFGERRVTISTVGLVPLIRRFADENRQINLAISLHAVDDAQRSSMMPINKQYPIAKLLEACRYYINKTRRRITFEWALIRDVNDSPETAIRLAGLLKGMLCHVNVIPLNPTQRYPGQATTRERAQAFQAELEKRGITCSIRIRRGIDIQAGCGQLAIQASDASNQP
ncbi:23S rRNA (adenine(2503)-C(2))-methyltransferase RlmN [Levilinea saccharolytica]|uniref:Probable dual-specificity RNA methyltransferase RlmN n=1 Tax=Levilinea saccharolytica TaxID=229921 RepID=A0A0P6XW40_9CHLR|nr:23S rRNA (adenine(2503)-C(2))-methyltransferase RlmN [Levilinea saccharolytica]KPL83496.1 ribosomal RNA large subunit methyltransferase N [Levilinea saccharolytica]GAP18284.1 23S rRNA m(2)A-2503 methyltransferase [Levilinea saccharolytica]